MPQRKMADVNAVPDNPISNDITNDDVESLSIDKSRSDNSDTTMENDEDSYRWSGWGFWL